MNTITKAVLIDGEVHGVELNLDVVAGRGRDDLRIVKDYGVVVLMGKCPCKYNAHQVEGPCFWLNPRVIKRRGGRFEGTVDVLVHDSTYCLPENQGEWSCNRGHAIGRVASDFLNNKIGFKEFKVAVRAL